MSGYVTPADEGYETPDQVEADRNAEWWTCGDCGGTTCDETCPSALVVEHEAVLADIDAWDDFQATTYPDERWTA